MSKKSNLADPEKTPEIKEKPSIEDVIAEGAAAQDAAEKKVVEDAKAEEDAAKAAQAAENAEKEKTKKETIETIKSEVVEPLKEQIESLKQKQTPEEKDEYDKFVDKYTEENGKAPEWKQVAGFLKEQAVAEVEAKQKAAQDAVKKTEVEAKAKQEQVNNEYFKVWQGQLEEIEKQNLIPKMEKPEKGDKGFDARVTLYGLMQSTWNKPGIQPITNIYEAYTKFKDKLTTEIPGADAPISMGNSGIADDRDQVKYKDIHEGSQDLESYAIKVMNEAQKAK